MSKAKRHVHKYHKIEINYSPTWACALPDCSHYMPQHMKEMVIGRYSICWDCGEKFILDPMNMKKDRPICRDCEPKVELPPEIANILLGE